MDSNLGPLEGTEFYSRPISSRTRGGGSREGVRGQSDAAPKARSNAGQTSVEKLPDHTSGPLPLDGSDPAARAGEGGTQLPPDEFARLARDRLNQEVRAGDEAGRGEKEGAVNRPNLDEVEEVAM